MADPSMEEILASIRRILSEDEATPALSPSAPATGQDDVLALDSSMIVEEPKLAEPAAVAPPGLTAPDLPPPAATAPTVAPPTLVPPVEAHPAETRAARELVAPETAAAVTSSVGGLLRTLIAERDHVVVHRSGPTIEDLVREEIRPLLKDWLDVNLQQLVERLVRTEIERLVGRALT
jgi:cell pole-organizing protein PopZ